MFEYISLKTLGTFAMKKCLEIELSFHSEVLIDPINRAKHEIAIKRP